MGRPRKSDKRPPLSPDAIANAALTLVDHEGLESLSMRRIAGALGVEAMALYHHFPSKEVLVDAVLQRGSPGSLPALTGKWRRDVKATMRVVYEHLSAHPALLPVRWERRVNSPEAKLILERERQIFEAAGIKGALARDAHRLLGSYVVGFVVVGIEARRTIREGEWFPQFEAGLEILLDGLEARRRRRV
ncbi:MAG: TetR/AcrR family transcriptional regulator [Terracidiphilus sp.]